MENGDLIAKVLTSSWRQSPAPVTISEAELDMCWNWAQGLWANNDYASQISGPRRRRLSWNKLLAYTRCRIEFLRRTTKRATP